MAGEFTGHARGRAVERATPGYCANSWRTYISLGPQRSALCHACARWAVELLGGTRAGAPALALMSVARQARLGRSSRRD